MTGSLQNMVLYDNGLDTVLVYIGASIHSGVTHTFSVRSQIQADTVKSVLQL